MDFHTWKHLLVSQRGNRYHLIGTSVRTYLMKVDLLIETLPDMSGLCRPGVSRSLAYV